MNYNLNAFEKFEIVPWSELQEVEFGTKSVQIKPRNKPEYQMEVFGSYLDSKDKYSFYAGGPIRASDWCPTSKNVNVVAIAVDDKFDEPTKSIVQIWTFDTTNEPKFKIMLDLGQVRINSLKWCPSIKRESDDPRLGILAVATSSGTAQVLVLGKDMLENENIKYFNAKACRILKRQDYSGDCLSLDWYRGQHHRILAGTFMVSPNFKRFRQKFEFEIENVNNNLKLQFHDKFYSQSFALKNLNVNLKMNYENINFTLRFHEKM